MDETLSSKLLRAVKEREKVSPEENYSQRSSTRLLQIGGKKIRTTMIGCIAEVEKTFGSLWGGLNAKPEDMNDEERNWYEIWQIVRKNMLNLGNNQIRAFQNELTEYTITWNRHNYMMPVKGPQE
jgi:hypothetical protein